MREQLSLAALETGSNVLIRGPVMTGKRRLMHELLAQGTPTERGTIIVTTQTNAGRARREFTRVTDGVARDHFSVVDCTGTGSAHGFATPRDGVVRVSTPGDLTGIGIGVTKFMRRYYEAGTGARLGLHSLSTMLMYADFRRVFQFLHVITGRLSNADFVGIFTLDNTTVDGSDSTLLVQLFDAVVDIRETPDGTREFRVRGAEFGPRQWTVLD